MTINTFDPYNFLIHRKFPDIPPAYLIGETSPRKMSANSEKVAEIQRCPHLANEYFKLLKSMSKNDFENLLHREVSANETEMAERAKTKEARQFFNQPYASADYNHWSKAAHWTLEEAVALSFGKNPEIVNWKRLQSIVNESAFAFQFSRLLDLARRAVVWEKLFDPVLPGIYIGWAKLNEINFPLQLEELVKRRGSDIGNWKLIHEQYVAASESLISTYEARISFLDSSLKERDGYIQALKSENAARAGPASSSADRPLSP